MSSMVLGDSTLESLTPSVNVPLKNTIVRLNHGVEHSIYHLWTLKYM